MTLNTANDRNFNAKKCSIEKDFCMNLLFCVGLKLRDIEDRAYFACVNVLIVKKSLSTLKFKAVKLTTSLDISTTLIMLIELR